MLIEMRRTYYTVLVIEARLCPTVMESPNVMVEFFSKECMATIHLCLMETPLGVRVKLVPPCPGEQIDITSCLKLLVYQGQYCPL